MVRAAAAAGSWATGETADGGGVVSTGRRRGPVEEEGGFMIIFFSLCFLFYFIFSIMILFPNPEIREGGKEGDRGVKDGAEGGRWEGKGGLPVLAVQQLSFVSCYRPVVAGFPKENINNNNPPPSPHTHTRIRRRKREKKR